MAVQGRGGRGFVHGLAAPWRAAAFLRQHKGLLRYVAIPLAVNTGIFSATTWVGLRFFDRIVSHYLPAGEAWYWALLSWLSWLVALVVVALLVFFSFTVVGNLIASPFNDLLSERVEDLVCGRGPDGGPAPSLAAVVRQGLLAVREEAKKVAVFVTGMLLLLLLHLLPGIGLLLYPPLSFFWTVFFLVVEYTGYVFSRKGLGFADQRRFIAARPATMFGFGCGVLCLLAIPLVQLLCIPLAVVGATLLWCEAQQAAR